MYRYVFELTPAKPHSSFNYCDVQDILLEAAEAANGGYAYRADGKAISIDSVMPQKIHLTLRSRAALTHAARCLSAFTRALTGGHPDVFSSEIYHRTLFRMDLISSDVSFVDSTERDVSDPELLRGIVNLLFFSPGPTKPERDLRAKTISEIKRILLPYL